MRVFSPNMKEIVFQGALDPHTPIAQGLAARLAPQARPEAQPAVSARITPTTRSSRSSAGEVYELDIEIWPTCIVVPAGYRIALTVRGRDYVYPGGSGGRLSNMKNEFTGCGPFLHDDPRDRPIAIFGGKTTIHFGEELRELGDAAGDSGEVGATLCGPARPRARRDLRRVDPRRCAGRAP